MSDHTIKETYASLKLIRRVDTLGRDIEQLIMAAYQYPQLSLAYRQLEL